MNATTSRPKMTVEQIRDHKARCRAVRERIEALRLELVDPYTVSLGRAAVECVRESLRAADRELDELRKIA